MYKVPQKWSFLLLLRMEDVLPEQESKLRMGKARETGNRRSNRESRNGRSQNNNDPPDTGEQPAQI